jgi:hypothetical protein
MKRIAANVCICVSGFLLLVDALPSLAPWHRRLKAGIDPLLDATGLWQQEWDLFAPTPTSRNAWMSARIECVDGTTITWESVRPGELSVLQKFLLFRETQYFEHIRSNSHSGAWESLADYLGRTETAGGGRAKSIYLSRHWWDVPPLGETTRPVPQSFEIYRKDFPK